MAEDIIIEDDMNTDDIVDTLLPTEAIPVAVSDDVKGKLVSLEDLKAYDGTVNDATTGINLLRGTRDFTLGTKTSTLSPYNSDGFYISPSSATHVTLSKDEQGFTVATIADSGQTTNTWLSIDGSTIYGLKNGQDVTISFDFMIKDINAFDYKFLFAIIDATGKGQNILRQVSDVTAEQVKSGVWYKARYVYTVTEYQESVGYFQAGLRLARNGEVSFRKFKIELGNINNPVWSASPFDIDYINDETTGINLFRGTRDFAHGNALIPSTPLYYDGWYWSNTVGKSFDKDDEGFTVLTVTSTTGTNQISNSTLAKLEAGEIYTFSFEYMQHDNHVYTGTQLGRVRVLGKSSDMPLLAYVNIADYVNNVIPEQWMTVKVPIVIPKLNQDAFLNVYFEMLTNINSSYSIRKACLYKGSINNPVWSISPLEVASIDVENGIPMYLGDVTPYRIPNDSSLNDLLTPGTYWFPSSAATRIADRPYGPNDSAVVYVNYAAGREVDGIIRQRLVYFSNSALDFTRIYNKNKEVVWSQWAMTWEPLGFKGVNIGKNADLNDITDPGLYQVEGSADSVTIANTPFTTSGYQLLVKQEYQNNRISQTARFAENEKVSIKYRTSINSGTSWSNWVDQVVDKVNLTDQVSNILPIANGGTGGDTAREAQYNLLSDIAPGDDTFGDTDIFICDNNAKNKNNGALKTKKATTIWNWIASKIRSVFGFTSDNKLPADRVDGLTIDSKEVYLYACDPESEELLKAYYNLEPKIKNAITIEGDAIYLNNDLYTLIQSNKKVFFQLSIQGDSFHMNNMYILDYAKTFMGSQSAEEYYAIHIRANSSNTHNTDIFLTTSTNTDFLHVTIYKEGSTTAIPLYDGYNVQAMIFATN